LQCLQTQVDKCIYKEWRAHVSGALNKCNDNYDDSAGGYIVGYHQKMYGADAYARQWASCGMQRLYAPFRGILAKDMELTDWNIVNSHPVLLAQLCGQYSLSCSLLTDYVPNRGSCLSLVINTVNKALAKALASTEEPAGKKKAPSALIGRKISKKLFIRMLFLGGFIEWAKDVRFKGSIPKVKELRKELKRIGNAIVKHSPALHLSVLAVTRDAEVCASKNPLSRKHSLILGDIENRCLMAAIAYIESLGLGADVLDCDGFVTHNPEEKICVEEMSERVFEATGYRIQWERKELDDNVKDLMALNDDIVAKLVMKQLRGRILNCNKLLFAYHAPSGLWRQDESPALMIREAIDDWGVDPSSFGVSMLKPLRNIPTTWAIPPT